MASSKTVLTGDFTRAARSGVYVQYGCGWCAPGGWVNFDASPTLRFERLPLVGKLYTRNARRFPAAVRYGDIVRGLPVAAGSVSGIYASHILEHLAYDDCMRALRNSYELLKPGGIFRLIVPDLEDAARSYLSALRSDDASAAEGFLESTALGRRQRPHGVRGLFYSMFNHSQHLWMWDYPAMAQALARQGFRTIRRCRFHDSEDPMFTRVEDAQRFEGALAIEARR